MPANPVDVAELERLLEALRETKTQTRMRSLFGGAIALPDPDEAREVLVNPDGERAADAIEDLLATLKRQRSALERIAGGAWGPGSAAMEIAKKALDDGRAGS